MATLVIVVRILSLFIFPICPFFTLSDLGFAEHAGSLLHHPLGIAEVRVRLIVFPTRALSAELGVVLIARGLSPVSPRAEKMVDLSLLEIGRVLVLELLKERKLF